MTTLLDLAVVLLSAWLVWSVAGPRLNPAGARSGRALTLIALGVCITGLFHLADLATIFALPQLIGRPQAVSATHALRLRGRWPFTLASLSLICVGLLAARRQRDLLLEDNDRNLRATSEELAALRKSEARLGAILSTAVDAIITIDASGLIQSCNSAAARMLGYSLDEMQGQNVAILAAGTDAERHDEFIERYLETGEAHIIGRGREVTARKRDGTELPVHLAVSEFLLEGERCFTGIMHDLTERRSAEAALRHSQRLETVGRLAGGIAHDFNNLLTVILGTAEEASAGRRNAPTPEVALHTISEAAERAAALTQNILAFSRRQLLQPRVISLNHLIEGLDPLFRSTLGERVELHSTLADDLGAVYADPSQLEQVILNLMVNAKEAIPENGEITIETANADLSRSYAERHLDVSSGPYVMISVTDSGIGMDAATRDRIFEPYFTTKGHQGTGLGLSTVDGIVRQSGGSIFVYSEPGSGTTFRIYLPRVESDIGPSPEKTATAQVDVHGTERILLVEDDDAVRALGARALERAGYRVVEARDPAEAIELFGQSPASVDLVVTDVMMPGLSGAEMILRMQRDRSDLRVLYTSGYGRNGLTIAGTIPTDVVFLAKPFTPRSLCLEVRRALDAE